MKGDRFLIAYLFFAVPAAVILIVCIAVLMRALLGGQPGA
jgi:hypothetical protein